MKTKEELNELKERLEKLSTELHELTDEELEQVTGGGYLKDDSQNEFTPPKQYQTLKTK